jgi:hypothetical protein
VDTGLSKPFAAYSGTESYVFVCYAHRNSDAIYADLVELRNQGVHIWYDEGIGAGLSWRAEIAGAIKGAGKLLYYISEESISSAHCLREVDYALSHDIEIVPVYLDEARLPAELDLALNRVQALFRNNDSMYMDHLVAALNGSTKFRPLSHKQKQRKLGAGHAFLTI